MTPADLQAYLHGHIPLSAKARIAVASTLMSAGLEAGRFEGEFVALGTTG